MSNEAGKGKAEQGSGGQKNGGQTEAQKAAQHDRSFGKTPDHMVAYYDGEHQVEKRS